MAALPGEIHKKKRLVLTEHSSPANDSFRPDQGEQLFRCETLCPDFPVEKI